MHFYEITARAEAEIDHIFNYIAQDSPGNAYRWLEKLYQSFAIIAEFPRLGRISSYRESMRIWPFGRYVILYRAGSPLQILRVLSSYRDIQQLL